MHFGYTNILAMHKAIAKKTRAAVSVVEYLLTQGKGTMFLNGYRIETFYTQEMGFYFLCD